MAGFSSYGAYVPLYRLSLNEIGAAWGRAGGAGEVAVCNYDEDSVTMAVEAVMDCLRSVDRERVDGLYFASTTMPYKEKQSASVIAMATGLRREILTADFSSSLSAGTNALNAAMHAIEAGAAKQVLVVASDCRLAAPGSEFEENFGDGAAAILLSDSDIVATFEGNYHHTNEFTDVWRGDSDRLVKSWENKFIVMHGYTENVQEAVSKIMSRFGLTPKDFSKAIFNAPDHRTLAAVGRSLWFDIRGQVQDPLFGRLGHTGCAFSLMLLAAALKQAKPDDRILLTNYGDGCDAFILRATDRIESVKERRGVEGHLVSRRVLNSYRKYLCFRQLMVRETSREPSRPLYGPLLWRERAQVLALHGSKCRRCGAIQFPIQRVCVSCQAKDEFEEVAFSDKPGRVFTYTEDHIAPCTDPPLIKAIVDFDGGGRGRFHVIDCDPGQIQIGMPVEMTFRRLTEGEIAPSYFWKCRPVRTV